MRTRLPPLSSTQTAPLPAATVPSSVEPSSTIRFTTRPLTSSIRVSVPVIVSFTLRSPMSQTDPKPSATWHAQRM
jgi:hypothetical protein